MPASLCIWPPSQPLDARGQPLGTRHSGTPAGLASCTRTAHEPPFKSGQRLSLVRALERLANRLEREKVQPRRAEKPTEKALHCGRNFLAEKGARKSFPESSSLEIDWAQQASLIIANLVTNSKQFSEHLKRLRANWSALGEPTRPGRRARGAFLCRSFAPFKLAALRSGRAERKLVPPVCCREKVAFSRQKRRSLARLYRLGRATKPLSVQFSCVAAHTQLERRIISLCPRQSCSIRAALPAPRRLANSSSNEPSGRQQSPGESN